MEEQSYCQEEAHVSLLLFVFAVNLIVKICFNSLLI